MTATDDSHLEPGEPVPGYFKFLAARRAALIPPVEPPKPDRDARRRDVQRRFVAFLDGSPVTWAPIQGPGVDISRLRELKRGEKVSPKFVEAVDAALDRVGAPK